jgi:nucleoid-associated protein YgaU
MVNKESFLALEEKLQTLTARLEKLEHDNQVHKIVAAEPAVAPIAAQQQVTEQPALASTEEAVAMANQALHQVMAKAGTIDMPQETIAQADETPKKSAKIAKAKATKGKAKQATDKTALVATKDSPVYVVKKGDTLSKISQRYFVTPNKWKVIYDANKERIANINNLKVGTALVIPQSGKKYDYYDLF